jgi:NAD(P)-dependent dehydrogenase (short-subunit alcohol dehydrogenase family)
LLEPLRAGGDLERALREVASHHPLGRLSSPEEIAEVVAFLASTRASFMTGSIVAADGGYTAG